MAAVCDTIMGDVVYMGEYQLPAILSRKPLAYLRTALIWFFL